MVDPRPKRRLDRGMKAILFALFVGLLLVGCEESSTPKAIDLDDKETLDKIIAEAIDGNTLQGRGKEGEVLAYARNQQAPYTGWVKFVYDNGQVRELSQYKDGKADGLGIEWYEIGQKEWEHTYKDGKLMTVVAWKPNGEKCPHTNVVDGNGVWVRYTPVGTEIGRTTYKDSERVGW